MPVTSAGESLLTPSHTFIHKFQLGSVLFTYTLQWVHSEIKSLFFYLIFKSLFFSKGILHTAFLSITGVQYLLWVLGP